MVEKNIDRTVYSNSFFDRILVARGTSKTWLSHIADMITIQIKKTAFKKRDKQKQILSVLLAILIL